MATMYVDTHAAAINAAISPTNRVVMRFLRLIDNLHSFYEAERDLAGCSGQDPAVDLWIREAEAAHADVIASVEAVLSCDDGDIQPHRRKLFNAALMFRTVLQSDDPELVTKLRFELSGLCLRPTGDLRVDALLSRAIKVFDAILELDEATEAPGVTL